MPLCGKKNGYRAGEVALDFPGGQASKVPSTAVICYLEQSLWNGALEGTSTLDDEWNEGGIFLLGQCLVLESLLAGAEM